MGDVGESAAGSSAVDCADAVVSADGRARPDATSRSEVAVFRSLLPLAVLMSIPAVAQEEVTEDGREIRYREVEIMDIDTPLQIDGELVKPNAGYILDQKRATFSPMIELRDSFASEMRGSVDQVK